MVGCYLVIEDFVDTEDFEVFTASIEEILLPAKMQIWKFLKESRDGVVQMAAAACPGDPLPSHGDQQVLLWGR